MFQSYSNTQNTYRKIRAQKHTGRSLELNRRSKSWAIWYLRERPKHIYWRENSMFKKWCLEHWMFTCRRIVLQWYLSPKKNNFRTISNTLHKYSLWIYQRPQSETWNTEASNRNHKQYPTRYKYRKGLSKQDSIYP